MKNETSVAGNLSLDREHLDMLDAIVASWTKKRRGTPVPEASRLEVVQVLIELEFNTL